MNVYFLCSLCTLLLLDLVFGEVVERNGFRTRDEQKQYLQKFGYLNSRRVNAASRPASASDASASMRSSSRERDPEVAAALRHFQRMAHIPQTGTFDEQTIRMMNSPRCGVPDVAPDGDTSRRKRYKESGKKWYQSNLLYTIHKFTQDLAEEDQVREIHNAFAIWSKAAPLGFRYQRNARSHLNISFERRDHGDWDMFDGPGETLAHAFFPPHGGIHLDDDELWTLGRSTGGYVDLLQVMVHEIGHALGLDHSEIYDSIMYPYYKNNLTRVELHEDDISGIRRIYPTRRRVPPRPRG